jgi:hypothetical protein
MAEKKKKSVKVRDLKPSKDTKGGAVRNLASHQLSSNRIQSASARQANRAN